MSRILIFISLFILTGFAGIQQARAQNAIKDSLLLALEKAPNDTVRIKTLWELSDYYQNSQPDTSLALARKALLMSQKMNYERGVSWSLNQIAGALLMLGNYNKALEYYLDQLKVEEKTGDPYMLSIINLNIANAYHKQEDYAKAIVYAFKADSMIVKNNLDNLRAYSQLNIGEMFEKMNLLDSALFHTIKAGEMTRTLSPELRGPALNNLANIYVKMDFVDVALSRYYEGLPYLKEANAENFMCETYLGLASLYKRKANFDSAFYFAHIARNIANQSGFLEKAILANEFLSNLSRQTGKMDSAYYYLNATVALKDSIFGKTQIRVSKQIAMDEEIRQADIAAKKLKEAQEREASMQWLAIGIFIPLFFIITVYMSRKKVKIRIIKTAGIISLLLLFEYITLLLHPRVVAIAHHIPILEVLIFVCIAALLTPTHHHIENLLIKRLTAGTHHTSANNHHTEHEAIAGNEHTTTTDNNSNSKKPAE